MYFIKHLQKYADILSTNFFPERKAKVWFEDSNIRQEFMSLIAHECTVCPKSASQRPFSSFHDLQQHMRKDHQLFYCNICTNHIKVSEDQIDSIYVFAAL